MVVDKLIFRGIQWKWREFLRFRLSHFYHFYSLIFIIIFLYLSIENATVRCWTARKQKKYDLGLTAILVFSRRQILHQVGIQWRLRTISCQHIIQRVLKLLTKLKYCTRLTQVRVSRIFYWIVQHLIQLVEEMSWQATFNVRNWILTIVNVPL